MLLVNLKKHFSMKQDKFKKLIKCHPTMLISYQNNNLKSSMINQQGSISIWQSPLRKSMIKIRKFWKIIDKFKICKKMNRSMINQFNNQNSLQMKMLTNIHKNLIIQISIKCK